VDDVVEAVVDRSVVGAIEERVADLTSRLRGAPEDWTGEDRAALEEVRRLHERLGRLVARHHREGQLHRQLDREHEDLRSRLVRLRSAAEAAGPWAGTLFVAVRDMVASSRPADRVDASLAQAARALIGAADTTAQADVDRVVGEQLEAEAAALVGVLPGRLERARRAVDRLAGELDRSDDRAARAAEAVAQAEATLAAARDVEVEYHRGLATVVAEWIRTRGEEEARRLLVELVDAGAPGWLLDDLFPVPEPAVADEEWWRGGSDDDT
jgi:ABC-type transporter Mla subunit MlaD